MATHTTAKKTTMKKSPERIRTVFETAQDFVNLYSRNPHNPRDEMAYAYSFEKSEDENEIELILPENEEVSSFIESLIDVCHTSKTVTYRQLQPVMATAEPVVDIGERVVVEGNSRHLVLELLLSKKGEIEELGYTLVTPDVAINLAEDTLDLRTAFVGYNTSVRLDAFTRFLSIAEYLREVYGQDISTDQALSVPGTSKRDGIYLRKWVMFGDVYHRQAIVDTSVAYRDYIPNVFGALYGTDTKKFKVRTLFENLVANGVKPYVAARIVGLPNREKLRFYANSPVLEPTAQDEELFDRFFKAVESGFITSEAEADSFWKSLVTPTDSDGQEMDDIDIDADMDDIDIDGDTKIDDGGESGEEIPVNTLTAEELEKLRHLEIQSLLAIADSLEAAAQIPNTESLAMIPILGELLKEEIEETQKEVFGRFFQSAAEVFEILAKEVEEGGDVHTPQLKKLMRLGGVKAPKEKAVEEPTTEEVAF